MKSPILYLCAIAAATLFFTTGCTDPGTPTRDAANVKNYLTRFAEDPSDTTTYYTLETSVSPTRSGTVLPSGTNRYEAGTTVYVSARANGKYKFDRWSGSSISTDSNINVFMNANLKLTAMFSDTSIPTPSNVTVTFDPRNGNMKWTALVLQGGYVTPPSNPTRDGYTFVGWYSDTTFADAAQWSFQANAVTSNTTLYARWVDEPQAPIWEKGFFTYDGQTYQTIKIGGLWWMARNLVSPSSEFAGGMGGASWCYDGATDCPKNGRLYDWAAAAPDYGVCSNLPGGWRLPKNTDWNGLITSLGGGSDAAEKLKDPSGWAAQYGGYRDTSGNYNFSDSAGYWWSASYVSENGDEAYSRYISRSGTNVVPLAAYMGYGYSVRCVKD